MTASPRRVGRTTWMARGGYSCMIWWTLHKEGDLPWCRLRRGHPCVHRRVAWLDPCSWLRFDVVCVFDAPGAAEPKDKEDNFLGIRVVYACTSADEYIERESKRLQGERNVWAATNDNAVQASAAVGVEWLRLQDGVAMLRWRVGGPCAFQHLSVKSTPIILSRYLHARMALTSSPRTG